MRELEMFFFQHLLVIFNQFDAVLAHTYFSVWILMVAMAKLNRRCRFKHPWYTSKRMTIRWHSCKIATLQQCNWHGTLCQKIMMTIQCHKWHGIESTHGKIHYPWRWWRVLILNSFHWKKKESLTDDNDGDGRMLISNSTRLLFSFRRGGRIKWIEAPKAETHHYRSHSRLSRCRFPGEFTDSIEESICPSLSCLRIYGHRWNKMTWHDMIWHD